MQLPGIVAFLFLVQYEVASASRHDEHLARELELFQNSLVERIYDDISLYDDEDNNDIDEIAHAIFREAERRLQDGELNKRHNSEKNSNDGVSDNIHGNSVKKDATHKVTESGINNDAVNQHSAKTQEEERENSKREVFDDGGKKEKEKRDFNRQVNIPADGATPKSKRDTILLHQQDDMRTNDVVKMSGDDNNQVATVNIDNSPDQQIQLANNRFSGKDLFLEPDVHDSKLGNKSKYAVHHGSRSPSPQRVLSQGTGKVPLDEISFIAIIVGCCVAGVVGIGLVSFCWYKLRTKTKELKSGSPNMKSYSQRSGSRKKTSDEEKLARGAEVFHYLHAKKQMQQMEEPSIKSDHCSINESSDDEEDDEDTVYECPGLAPPGDMKVVNPLFSDTESHYSDPPSLHSTPTPPLEEK